MFKMSTIQANKRLRHCAIATVMMVWSMQQPPLPQQTFFQLRHIMNPRTVDPLLKDTPDIVHRIQIWRIGWPHKLASLSAAWRQSRQCHVHAE